MADELVIAALKELHAEVVTLRKTISDMGAACSSCRQSIDRHERILFGNGQPGIAQRLDRTEANISNIAEEITEGRGRMHNWQIMLISAGIGLGCSVVSGLLIVFIGGA